MDLTPRQLAGLYSKAHDLMRNIDGLQPQEAFDELLKYLFFKEIADERGETVKIPFELTPNGSYARVNSAAAKRIRSLFKSFAKTGAAAKQLWADSGFRLSDAGLLALHDVFDGLNLKSISFDKRSTALREFVPGEIRRGLGIFLTPDDVVAMMVAALAPKQGGLVFDPACGSGTFLIEALKHWGKRKKRPTVHGADKNPRMLLLAELNLGHSPDAEFTAALADSLFDDDRLSEIGIRPNSVDYIFTNPPFGVILDGSAAELQQYDTCMGEGGSTLKRQQSEVVFIERCLRLLRPGGWLAIVLPKSVITNNSLASARGKLDALGHVAGVVVLPPETFATAGTQTTTVVLFMRKYKPGDDRAAEKPIAVARVGNVGFDSTGRARDGNELPSLGSAMREALEQGHASGAVTMVGPVPLNMSSQRLSVLLSDQAGRVRPNGNGLRRLGDLVQEARTGRTPARSAYSDTGLFLVKVGNLTGHGISWLPRDRNFVDRRDRERRSAANLLVRRGDILLTSSAHSPVYIAKKVDVVTQIPVSVGGEASFVGEVMLIRPTDELDPYNLVAFLRHPATQATVQAMVRGQTAHLHPDDLLELRVPAEVIGTRCAYSGLAALIREEAQVNDKLNEIAIKAEDCFSALPI